MRVVLTREAGMNESLQWLIPDTAETIQEPLTRTEFVSTATVATELGRVHTPQNIAITSARAAEYVPLALEQFGELPIYCVGEATATALQSVGATATWVGTAGGHELGQRIPGGPVLLLGSADFREELPTALAERGIEFQSIACYTTLPVELTAQSQESLRGADVLFIGAPSAWAVAREYVRPETVVVASGETTAAVVRETHTEIVVGWGEETKLLLAEMAKTNN